MMLRPAWREWLKRGVELFLWLDNLVLKTAWREYIRWWALAAVVVEKTRL